MSSIPAVVDLVTQSEQPQAITLSMFERLARDPSASVEKIERLMALVERQEARRSEALFNASMSEAQKAIRPVVADKFNTQTRSAYPSYEALDREVRPIYTDHGFGLSFDTGDAPAVEYVRVLCYATHAGGHARTYHVDMPADGKGAKGGDVMTKTHAAGSAYSYGMRYLLKMIFNIPVRLSPADDDDGNGANRKEEKSDTKKPAGFDAWLVLIESVAENGMREFSKAWNDSAEVNRNYLARTDPKRQAAIKTKAANSRPK